MADDVLIQKLASIDRCLASVRRTVVEHRLGDFEALVRELVAAS